MVRFFKFVTGGRSCRAGVLCLSCLLAVSMLFSCQEGGEAGDLFGQWRLKGADSIYICFSGSVVVLQYINKGEVNGNFRHEGDSLFIQCYSLHGEPTDTMIVEKAFGFPSFTNTRLKIDYVDDDKLILSKTNRTWRFIKW